MSAIKILTVKVENAEVQISVQFELFEPNAPGAIARSILLLHGNPAHLGHYDGIRHALAEIGDLYLVDAPGFGHSPLAEATPTLAFQAQCALLAARELGARGRLDVIGHSHGGAVAQTLAALYPADVRSVVLIGSTTQTTPLAYRPMSIPRLYSAIIPMVRALSHRTTRASLRSMVKSALRLGTYPERWVNELWVEREVALVTAHPTVIKASLQTARAFDPAALAAHAKCIVAPILIVHGDGDILVPIRLMESHARLFVSSARVDWARLEGVGHLPHISRPSLVSPILLRWLAEVEPAQSGGAQHQ